MKGQTIGMYLYYYSNPFDYFDLKDFNYVHYVGTVINLVEKPVDKLVVIIIK